MTDFDEQARQFFLGQLEQHPEAQEPAAAEPATDPDPLDLAWTQSLSPDELELASVDGVEGERLYQRWLKAQPRLGAQASAAPPAVAPAAAASPNVLAYEAAAGVRFEELRRDEQEAVVERALDRRLGPRTAAMLAFEHRDVDERAVPQAHRTASIQRAFERRGAMERARRGDRP